MTPSFGGTRGLMEMKKMGLSFIAQDTLTERPAPWWVVIKYALRFRRAPKQVESFIGTLLRVKEQAEIAQSQLP